jgi:hypothetical protein
MKAIVVLTITPSLDVRAQAVPARESEDLQAQADRLQHEELMYERRRGFPNTSVYTVVVTTDPATTPIMNSLEPTRSTWVTRDGKHIPITELEDAHLANIIKQLYRKAGVLHKQAVEHCYTFDWRTGEDAIVSPGEWLRVNAPIWNVLLDEVLRRGLEPFQGDTPLLRILREVSA